MIDLPRFFCIFNDVSQDRILAIVEIFSSWNPGHDVECGPNGLNSCEVVDKWQDDETGKIYHLSEFKTHRRHQALRIAALSFLYGLIACWFHVWYEVRYEIKNIDNICFGDIEREKLYRKQIFNQELRKALIYNGIISAMWYVVI